MKKRVLTVAILTMVLSGSLSYYAEAKDITQQYELQGIVVEGESEGDLPGGFAKQCSNVGILGNKEIMDTPFTKVNLSEKAINSFATPGEGISSALLNVPSVKSASSTMYNDVNIRGSRVNGYQFYLNGVPGLFTQTNIPTNFINNIEVTSGPAMSFTGTTT